MRVTLTPPQRAALEWMAKGNSARGAIHGITINHLKRKRLIENSDTVSEAGREWLRNNPTNGSCIA